MGSQFGKDAKRRGGSLLAGSIGSLRGAMAALGGAAVVSSIAEAGTVAKELSRAERRRRQRQRERDDEDDDRGRNRRDDDDDDDGGLDRFSALRALQARMRDRGSDSSRRETSRQSAEDGEIDRGGSGDSNNADGDATGGRRNQRDEEATDDGADFTETIQAPQTVNETESTGSGSSTEIRVGSGDTFASIDPETGTAIAESNGVRAIAGPEGAFIEGTPGGDAPPPAGEGDDGTGDPGRQPGGGGGDDAGGDNGDGGMLS